VPATNPLINKATIFYYHEKQVSRKPCPQALEGTGASLEEGVAEGGIELFCEGMGDIRPGGEEHT
jgi:hypothetical protein